MAEDRGILSQEGELHAHSVDAARGLLGELRTSDGRREVAGAYASEFLAGIGEELIGGAPEVIEAGKEFLGRATDRVRGRAGRRELPPADAAGANSDSRPMRYDAFTGEWVQDNQSSSGYNSSNSYGQGGGYSAGGGQSYGQTAGGNQGYPQPSSPNRYEPGGGQGSVADWYGTGTPDYTRDGNQAGQGTASGNPNDWSGSGSAGGGLRDANGNPDPWA